MEDKKITLDITGLHCRSCELLIEDGLKQIPEIKKVSVSHKKGQAEICYSKQAPSINEMENIIADLGYKLGSEKKTKKSWRGLIILGITALAFLVLNYFGLLNISLDWLSSDLSWPLAILVGLVAGVSTCMALVGGLVLAVSASYAKRHPEANKWQKFQPHLIFNGGRLIGFFILGGLLGLLGSSFKLSATLNGIIALIIGLVILALGLRLLGFLEKLELSLPKSLARRFKINNPNKSYKKGRTIALGALTFFIPCGFTQAMQIYALGSGDFLSGGLIMAAFALGTSPGLLGIGGLAAIIKGKRADIFFQIAGAVIIIFALFNINNGYSLLKVSALSTNRTPQVVENKSTANNEGEQVLYMIESSRGYSPNQFTIKKNVPVRLIIDARSPYSCASSFMIPSLNISRQLKSGENIITFTPKKAGNIPFSCSMGMYTGNFRVIE